MKRKQNPTLASLLGVLACACFVLQQFCVPLHLSLHHHEVAGAVFEHGHSHLDHSDGNGDPHPGQEHHLEQLVVSAAPPGSVHVSLALPASRTAPDAPNLTFVGRTRQDTLTPRPPPTRTATAPRGPPISA